MEVVIYVMVVIIMIAWGLIQLEHTEEDKYEIQRLMKLLEEPLCLGPPPRITEELEEALEFKRQTVEVDLLELQAIREKLDVEDRIRSTTV